MSGLLRSGTRLGSYRIVAPLGAGGMGEVYRAHDSELDRAVALKILPAEVVRDAERIRRFAQEAKAHAAGIVHRDLERNLSLAPDGTWFAYRAAGRTIWRKSLVDDYDFLDRGKMLVYNKIDTSGDAVLIENFR